MKFSFVKRLYEVSTFFIIFFFCVNKAEALKSTNKLQKIKKSSYSAVYTFGDSVLDTGNNNNLIKTLIKSDFPPYGSNFLDGKPTGRFSDGKVPSDFIVEAMGIKEILPTFFDPDLQSEDLQTGVNFASGGSGWDPLTEKIQKVYSPSDELQFFKEYIAKLKGIVGEERSKTIIANGLYVISYGSNDLLFSYFFTHLRKSQFDVPSYTNLLLSLASNFFKGLYELGARKIAIMNLGPLGCVPLAKTLGGGLERGCYEEINEAAQLYNSKLSNEVASLQKQLPGIDFVIWDFYNSLLDILQHSTRYDFEEINRGCCGTGLLETVVLCNQFNPKTCKNASAYMFFDSIHPSQRTYQIAVSKFLQ